MSQNNILYPESCKFIVAILCITNVSSQVQHSNRCTSRGLYSATFCTHFVDVSVWFHVCLFHMEEGHSAVTKEVDSNILWVEIQALAISLS